MNTSTPPSANARALVLWVIWGGILVGLLMIYFALGRGRPLPEESTLVVDCIGFGLLASSSVLRWLVMPGVTQHGRALILLVMGLALAEGCGFFGIFLSQHREALVILGAVGMLQWTPLFASRLEAVNSGFRPR